MTRLIVLVAEGFGLGRSPVAPGTFGTLLGFAWIYLLLVPASLTAYLLGTVVGVLAALWIGARAELALQLKDPGSIVIDEICALPVVFLPVLLANPGQSANGYFARHWFELILVFAFFRLFDIWKPLGIRQSQNLPGGLVWDDVLAAVLASVALWVTMLIRARF